MSKLNFFASAARPVPKDPHAFILPLVEPVQVTRAAGGFIQLQWQELADKTTVYVADTLDGVVAKSLGLNQIVSVANAREAMVVGLDTAVRHYFRLEFEGGAWDGRSLLAAERVLPLQKGVNIRDAGGYHTQDGQMVRWGKLYRSGSLSRLTPADLAYLHHLGIKLVCDLRSVGEREKQPDKLPSDPNLVERPLPMSSVEWLERLRGAFYVFFRKGRIDNFMLDNYQRVIIDNNAPNIGEIFQRLADPAQLPALLHCTVGKDRTGLVVALLLLTLGVSEETVLADYTLSNQFYEQFRKEIAADLKEVAPWGISVDDLQDLLLVKAKTLQGTLIHLRQKYGSLENYLRDAANVSNETILQLRSNWLMSE